MSGVQTMWDFSVRVATELISNIIRDSAWIGRLECESRALFSRLPWRGRCGNRRSLFRPKLGGVIVCHWVRSAGPTVPSLLESDVGRLCVSPSEGLDQEQSRRQYGHPAGDGDQSRVGGSFEAEKPPTCDCAGFV